MLRSEEELNPTAHASEPAGAPREPAAPEAREIPTELLTAEESTSQLETMVWLSSTRGTFVGERPEYELARPRTAVGQRLLPTFTFGTGLAGLVLLVIVLAVLAPAVRRGGVALQLASWVLSVIMLMNGPGHPVRRSF